MSRRVLSVTLVAAVVLAGCSAGGPSRVVASGSPATVETGALDGTGYEYVGTSNQSFNTTWRRLSAVTWS